MAGSYAAIGFVVALLPSATQAAATLCVKPGGGDGCQATITLALAAAQTGDTIRVAQGTYEEFVFIDQTVVLEGGWDTAFAARDPAVFVTTIQAPVPPAAQFSVLRISGPASPTVDGFTITGGRADLDSNHGGGVSIRFGSNAVLRRNVISNNSAYLFGGGVWIQGGAPWLDRNRIEDNTAVGDGSVGGGVMLENSPATLTSNVIARNHLSGVATLGGGVGIYATDARVVNNTLADNDAHGVYANQPLVLSNNIVSGHPVGLDLQTCPAACATATVSFNDFFGNTADTAGWTLDGSNLLANPLLTADQHLTAASTLIDAGTHSGAPAFDLDGESRVMAGAGGLFRPDIGADEFPGAPQRVVDLDTASADLTIIGPGGIPGSPTNGVNDWIGFSALAADVNGDGRDDLVTSAEDWADDPNNAPRTTGRLFGVFNSGQRVTGTLDLLTTPSDLTVACTLNLQHIGAALVSGDVSGNGVPDLVAGSSRDDNAGGGAVFPTVFVFRGGASLAGTRTLGADTPADFTLQAPGQDFFGFSIKNALATGDVNNDGVADLLVGDALADPDGATDAGAVFVMFGGPGLPAFRDLAATPADYTLTGAAAGEGLGTLAVGRVDAGAQVDLVARTDTAAYVMLGPLPSPGPTSIGASQSSIMITGLQAPHDAQGSLLVADLTGDGVHDIVMASGNDLLVVPGPLVAGETFAAASRAVLTLTDAFASALASADVTGDDRADLIVGSRQRRQAFVVAGGSGFTGSHFALDLAVTVLRGADITNLGWDVSAGDLDFDGGADVVVSSFGADVASHPAEFTDAGLVFVVYGTGPKRIFANGFELDE